jgi:hypothetical protein
MTGISAISAIALLRNLGFKLFRRSAFFASQTLLIPEILIYAKKVTLRNRNRMQPGATVIIDGSWSHQRNASEDIAGMRDCTSAKIVADFEIMTRKNPGRPGELQRKLERNGSSRV